MSPYPRAILFDLDDTILSAYTRPDLAWQVIAEEYAAHIAPLAPGEVAGRIAAVARRVWADEDRAREERKDLPGARRRIVAEALGDTLNATLAGEIADRFTAYREEQMHVFPGAAETIDILKAAGVKLALVTNGDAVTQRGKIDRFDLAHRFHHIQIEGEAGFGKPDLRAYEHALEALGVTAADAWIVGDNLEWEVAAPQRLGLFAIWHDHKGEGLPEGSPYRPDRIIRTLSDLIAPSDPKGLP